MKAPKFLITKGRTAQFYFQLLDAEGMELLNSNNYVDENSCQEAISVLKQVVSDDTRFRKNIPNNDQFFFALITRQGETLAKSHVYPTYEAREEAVQKVRESIGGASTFSLN